jgi:hypothetical protein
MRSSNFESIIYLLYGPYYLQKRNVAIQGTFHLFYGLSYLQNPVLSHFLQEHNISFKGFISLSHFISFISYIISRRTRLLSNALRYFRQYIVLLL